MLCAERVVHGRELSEMIFEGLLSPRGYIALSHNCFMHMQVRKGTQSEVEAFVHGALCVSYRYATLHHYSLHSSDHLIHHAFVSWMFGCMRMYNVTRHILPVPYPHLDTSVDAFVASVTCAATRNAH